MVLEPKKEKVVICNMNLDGVMTSMMMRVLFPTSTINTYYARSIREGSVLINNIIDAYENNTTLKELIIINLKLSVNNVERLNKIVNEGVTVHYYGYLYEPSSFIGNTYFTPGTLSSEIMYLQLKHNGHDIKVEDVPKVNNIVHWAKVGMLYEGDISNIDYIEAVNSLARDVTKGINTMYYNKMLDRMLMTVYSKFILERPEHTATAIYYLGRKIISKDIFRTLNIHGKDELTIPDGMVDLLTTLGSHEYESNGLTFRMYLNITNFNKVSKILTNTVDFVLNIGDNGYVQVRCRHPHDAKSISASMGAKVIGDTPVKAYAFNSGLRINTPKGLGLSLRQAVFEEFLEKVVKTYSRT